MSRDPSKMQLVQGETGTGWAEAGHRAKEAEARTWKAGWETANNGVARERQESNASPLG